VPTGERGERMATALIDYAVETINFEVSSRNSKKKKKKKKVTFTHLLSKAKSRGHLSGCNVIFMETSSDSKTSDSSTGDFSDLTQQHPGFFLFFILSV